MSSEYSEYLQSEVWAAKRRERLLISNFQCAACGVKSRSTDVHHLTYERIFKEEMTDLMPLCRKHHDVIERLISERKFGRTGNVQFLATETIRMILLHSRSSPAKRKSKKSKRMTHGKELWLNCREIEWRRREDRRIEDAKMMARNIAMHSKKAASTL